MINEIPSIIAVYAKAYCLYVLLLTDCKFYKSTKILLMSINYLPRKCYQLTLLIIVNDG